MAVAVLIQFEDDQEAKEFVRDILGGMGVPVSPRRSTVRGAWKVPTKFCDPSDGHLRGKGKTGAAFTRGQKWGWWVCTACGKPTKDYGKGGSWDYVLGTNLLPKEISAEPRRPGWERSPMQWDFLLATKEDNDGD